MGIEEEIKDRKAKERMRWAEAGREAIELTDFAVDMDWDGEPEEKVETFVTYIGDTIANIMHFAASRGVTLTEGDFHEASRRGMSHFTEE